MSHVTYTTISPDGVEEKYTDVPCFSDIRRFDQTKLGFDIEYSWKARLDKEKLDFWAGFLIWMLGDDKWTWCYEGDSIVWYLNAKDMSFHKALVYLTGFRYHAEFPRYIEALYEVKDKPGVDLFREFWDFHMDEEKALGGNSNHNYLDRYTVKNLVPITIERFREHLANPNLTRVNEHFEA
jgi:hypothetical protein